MILPMHLIMMFVDLVAMWSVYVSNPNPNQSIDFDARAPVPCM